MNIGEYINKRLADVRYYLRGINYNKSDSEKAVEGLSDSVNAYFNDNEVYRVEVNKLVSAIKHMYDTLKDHELEFAASEEEVDDAILNFELKLKELIKIFKNNILAAFQNDTGHLSNLLDSGLDGINIKIRDKNEKTSVEELHKRGEFNGLREIFRYMHDLIYFLKDKSCKLANFKEVMKQKYKVGSLEYKRCLDCLKALDKTRNYYEFLEAYEYITSQLNLNIEPQNQDRKIKL